MYAGPWRDLPDAVATNAVLIENVRDFTGATATRPTADPANGLAAESAPVSQEAQRVAEFRSKFEAQYRATDGHYVRSRAELAIDNWLYMTNLGHAYERKLPIEEDVYCDFYLPDGKVYIEYWGMENDSKYAKRKAEKLRIYSKYDYHLIELTDDDILSIDDVLPRKLLKFGIKTDWINHETVARNPLYLRLECCLCLPPRHAHFAPCPTIAWRPKTNLRWHFGTAIRSVLGIR